MHSLLLSSGICSECFGSSHSQSGLPLVSPWLRKPWLLPLSADSWASQCLVLHSGLSPVHPGLCCKISTCHHNRPAAGPWMSMPYWHWGQPRAICALPSCSTGSMWPHLRLVVTARQWALFRVWERQQKPKLTIFSVSVFTAFFSLWVETTMGENNNKTCTSDFHPLLCLSCSPFLSPTSNPSLLLNSWLSHHSG